MAWAASSYTRECALVGIGAKSCTWKQIAAYGRDGIKQVYTVLQIEDVYAAALCIPADRTYVLQ